MAEVDPGFLELPMRRMADAALQRVRDLGAEHADFRLERLRNQDLVLRDGRVDSASDGQDVGFAVRVVHDGTWGFAAGVDLTPEAAVAVAERAVEVARVSRPVNSEPIELAEEPVHADVTWVSPYEVNPFDVPDADKIGLIADWSERLLAADGVDHVQAMVFLVQENKFYADLAGTITT
ncbi:MAG TPA: DNA gyrase modulator, partial [Mycobacteriales bacterium]|nr:DNA gyrase modulator [Mycobacteriales bacterium]